MMNDDDINNDEKPFLTFLGHLIPRQRDSIFLFLESYFKCFHELA